MDPARARRLTLTRTQRVSAPSVQKAAKSASYLTIAQIAAMHTTWVRKVDVCLVTKPARNVSQQMNVLNAKKDSICSLGIPSVFHSARLG